MENDLFTGLPVRLAEFDLGRLQYMIDNPLFGSAVLHMLKTDPNLSIVGAFAIAPLQVERQRLFNQALAEGRLLAPDSLENCNHNRAVLGELHRQAELNVAGH